MKNKIFNIIFFKIIILNDKMEMRDKFLSAPDYMLEKFHSFIGDVIPKDILINKNQELILSEYYSRWGGKSKNKLMDNIILFLNESGINPINIINQFEYYFNDLSVVNEKDTRRLVHPVLLNFIYNMDSIKSRKFKLFMLKKKIEYARGR